MAIFSISAKAEVGILFRDRHGAVVHILEASDFEPRDSRIGWRRAHAGIRGAAFPFLERLSDQTEQLLRLRDEGLHPVLNILGLKR